MTRARFGARIRERRRLWRHQRADFLRREGLGYVEDADARVLVGRENQLRADETSGPVFVDIVRAEMPAFGLVVGFGRRRKRSKC